MAKARKKETEGKKPAETAAGEESLPVKKKRPMIRKEVAARIDQLKGQKNQVQPLEAKPVDLSGKRNVGIVATKGQQPPAVTNVPETVTKTPDSVQNDPLIVQKPAEPVQKPELAPGDSGGHDPSRPIGKGNPPRYGQIKKGQVRNPKGYPKGRPQAKTVIQFWLGQTEVLKTDLNAFAKAGLKITQQDAIVLALIGQARKGNVSAVRELLDRIEGKPVQSTKLLDANDKAVEIFVGFKRPDAEPPLAPEKKEVEI
jgi:hypothetical protein